MRAEVCDAGASRRARRLLGRSVVGAFGIGRRRVRLAPRSPVVGVRRVDRLGDALRCLGLARRAGGASAAFHLLEAELVVFLHLAHLLLHLQDLEVQLLDGAGEPADLFLELGDARIGGLRQLRPAPRRHRSLPQKAGQAFLSGLTRLAGRRCAGTSRGAPMGPAAMPAGADSSRTASAPPVIDRKFMLCVPQGER